MVIVGQVLYQDKRPSFFGKEIATSGFVLSMVKLNVPLPVLPFPSTAVTLML